MGGLLKKEEKKKTLRAACLTRDNHFAGKLEAMLPLKKCSVFLPHFPSSSSSWLYTSISFFSSSLLPPSSIKAAAVLPFCARDSKRKSNEKLIAHVNSAKLVYYTPADCKHNEKASSYLSLSFHLLLKYKIQS